MDMEVTHPSIQEMADLAESFCGRWFRRRMRSHWQIVVGPPGCGKTHVLRKIGHWVRAASQSAWEGEWRGKSLPSAIEIDWLTIASPEKCDDRSFEDIIRDVDESSLVLLDDIGTETDQYRTGVPVQRLCHLLNRCEQKWMWINTNISPSHWSSKWDNRVEDRLLGGTVYTNTAPSYRSEIPYA